MQSEAEIFYILLNLSLSIPEQTISSLGIVINSGLSLQESLFTNMKLPSISWTVSIHILLNPITFCHAYNSCIWPNLKEKKNNNKNKDLCETSCTILKLLLVPWEKDSPENLQDRPQLLSSLGISFKFPIQVRVVKRLFSCNFSFLKFLFALCPNNKNYCYSQSSISKENLSG